MTQGTLQPIAAFDVAASGGTTPIAEPWPGIAPAEGATWRWLHLDLADPGLEEWAEAHLPEMAATALLQTETRPRCTPLGDGTILNLRGVNLNPGQEVEDMVSLRLWATPALVVSVRIRRVYAVEDLRRAAMAGMAPETPGAFLAALADGLTDRLESVSLALEDDTDTLEETIMEGDALEPAIALAPLRRKAIRLRRFAGPQREALARLSEVADRLVAREDRLLIGESANRTTRVVEEIDSVTARLVALQDHVEARRSLSMGRNSYVLSVVAAIFLPLTFITGLFGVNVAGMPGIAWPWAFAALSIANIVIGIVLLLAFRRMKWL